MNANACIEFAEVYDAVDVFRSRLICPQLPAGHGCVITRQEDGTFLRRTKASGNGSIRCSSHRSLSDAYAAATAWARRKAKGASETLAELGARREIREDRHGETRSGWWLDGVWLAPCNKPKDALRAVNGN